MKKSRLQELAGLNESKSLQLSPVEAGKLKYILEQKLNQIPGNFTSTRVSLKDHEHIRNRILKAFQGKLK
jgi:hypothetical protein